MSGPAHDDRILIERVLGGDPDAADCFVTRFTRLVWAILIHQTELAPARVEDLYQEVFVRLWEDNYRRLRNWSGQGDFAAYLAPIVRHLAIDRLRRDRTRREEPLPNSEDPGSEPAREEPGPEEIARIGEERERLLEAVRGLSESDRGLYELRFEQERSYREISALLDLTVNNVGVRLARLVERLKRSLPEGEPPGGGRAPAGTRRVRLPGAGTSTH